MTIKVKGFMMRYIRDTSQTVWEDERPYSGTTGLSPFLFSCLFFSISLFSSVSPLFSSEQLF
jgi:hypothetical protein